MGCIGKYGEAVAADEFLGKLREACSPPWLLATDNRPEAIHCVAVCGGSGSDLASKALEEGAQVYVTSEVKHSTARWAEQAGLWVVDAGHFATEHQVLSLFAQQLTDESVGQSRKIEIQVTQNQKPPLLMV